MFKDYPEVSRNEIKVFFLSFVGLIIYLKKAGLLNKPSTDVNL